MKTFRNLNILGIVLLASATIAASRIAPAGEKASGSFSLRDLPPIVLEECIDVQKLIGRNPLSRIPNQYLLVTKYEEKNEENSIMKQRLIPGRALNVYLVQDLLVFKNLEAGIVHDTVLVVKVITTDAKSSRETVREWILIDGDGDRTVDRGIYRETVREEGKGPVGSKEIAFPGERLKELQAYYDKATSILNNKAESGPAEACVLT